YPRGGLIRPVSRTPVQHAIHDGRPVNYRPATVEAPQNLAGGRIECVHETGQRAGIDQSVSDADRSRIDRAGSRIGGLPDRLSGCSIECRPGAPGNLLSAGNQGVGRKVTVGNGGIGAPAVCGGAQLDAARTATWPHLRPPADVTITRIQSPVDTALLSEPDKPRKQVRTRSAEIVVRPCRRRAASRSLGNDAGIGKHVVLQQPSGPTNVTVGEIESQGGVEVVVGRGAVCSWMTVGNRLLLALQDGV